MNSPYDKLSPDNSGENNVGKTLRTSKTLWANLLMSGLASVAVFFQSDWIVEHPQYAGYASIVMGVVNVLLRIFGTSKPIVGV